MPFRSINAEPEELQALATAFDAAWLQINADAPIPAELQKSARDRLGYILYGLRGSRETDLAERAVAIFLSGDCHTPR